MPFEFSVAFRSLKYRNFQLFFGGQLLSLIGTWMQTVAQSWLVYRLTGSAAALGLVGFWSQIPIFLFAPLGGLLADRFNRRRIVLATQTASMILAFVLAFLTLAGRITVGEIVLLAGLLGAVNAFDIPARQAFVAEMVGKEELMNAIALNSSMFNGARIIGPAVAGVLVALVGEGWCFFANAVSYIAVTFGLLWMRLSPFRPKQTSESAIKQVLDGFRFVIKSAPIRALLLLLGLMSLMGMPYAVLMPIFADHILHAGSKGLGFLMGIAGIGALVGTLMLAARRTTHGLGLWVAISAAGFGTALVFFAFSHSIWLSSLFLFPVGLFMMVEMASSNTLIQAMVPDSLRGRVMSVYSMMFMGMAPLGSLIAGALSQKIGAPLTVAIGGVTCIIGGGIFALNRQTWRAEARRMVLKQQMTAGHPAQEAIGGQAADDGR